MNNRNFDQFNDMLKNIINRICHDIISPLTTIINGSELIKDRIELLGQNVKNDKQLSLHKLIDIINNSSSQIHNQINLFRYLYSSAKKPYKISIIQFIDNIQGFLNEYNIKLVFGDQIEEINNLLLQFISHIIFLFIDFFGEKSDVRIKLIKDKNSLIINFHINNKEQNNDSEIIKIISELKEPIKIEFEEINPINVNQYFFQNLLSQSKVNLAYKILDGDNREFTLKFNSKDSEKFF